MKQKWIQTDSELNKFISIFDRISGNPLDKSYLKAAQVRGFYINNELVGGYVINVKQPLRYFEWVPHSNRENARVNKHLDQGKSVEITCIWGDQTKTSRLKRRWIYWMCVFDAMRTGQTWIVGGSTIPKVAKIHRQVLPKLIYSGTTTLPQNPEGQLYCSRWIQLLLMIPIGFTYDIGSDILRSLVKKVWSPRKRVLTTEKV
jgi:hypothetical protein